MGIVQLHKELLGIRIVPINSKNRTTRGTTSTQIDTRFHNKLTVSLKCLKMRYQNAKMAKYTPTIRTKVIKTMKLQ